MGMQFGIFTVGDVTADPTTGTTPTENERIKATVAIAKKAEEIGLDGDVQDRRYRQAITAAGSGCMAALEVEKFLEEH